MPPSQVVGQLWSQLEESGLLSAPRLAEAKRSLADSGAVSDVDAAKLLVQRKFLTRFQAARLLEGRSRGFYYDEYKVVDILGVGGMGWVFEAENTISGKNVALKVLMDQLKHDRGMFARFHQEARVGLRLDHPNIVRTFATGSAGGLPYMIMELVHGPSLLEVLLRHKRLPWARACDVARQAALGLEYAHQLGLVHRDVKPQNLLVDETGRVRVLDFGLAMIREGVTGDEFSMAMIFGHECVGTAEFSAPEQAEDSLAVDARSDVYSLGGTLFAALTGTTPFQGKTAADMLQAHRSARLRSVREIVPTVPEGVADLVSKMLARDPDGRFATAAEASAALAEFAKPGPLGYDFEAILAERKKYAEQRLSQLPRSKVVGLASSTARPASSVAQAPSGVRLGTNESGSSVGPRSGVSMTQPALLTIRGPAARWQQSADAPPSERPEPAEPVKGVLTSLDTGGYIPLTQDRIVIGRRDDCDLQLDDSAVSNRHCELSFDGERWTITDLGSRNGTSVNGVPVKQKVLRSGDDILLGNLLRFRLHHTLAEAFAGRSRRRRRGRRTVVVWIAILLAAALLAAALWWGWTNNASAWSIM